MQRVFLDGFPCLLVLGFLAQGTVRLVILGNAFLQRLLHQSFFLFSLFLNCFFLLVDIRM